MSEEQPTPKSPEDDEAQSPHDDVDAPHQAGGDHAQQNSEPIKANAEHEAESQDSEAIGDETPAVNNGPEGVKKPSSNQVEKVAKWTLYVGVIAAVATVAGAVFAWMALPKYFDERKAMDELDLVERRVLQFDSAYQTLAPVARPKEPRFSDYGAIYRGLLTGVWDDLGSYREYKNNLEIIIDQVNTDLQNQKFSIAFLKAERARKGLDGKIKALEALEKLNVTVAALIEERVVLKQQLQRASLGPSDRSHLPSSPGIEWPSELTHTLEDLAEDYDKAWEGLRDIESKHLLLLPGSPLVKTISAMEGVSLRCRKLQSDPELTTRVERARQIAEANRQVGTVNSKIQSLLNSARDENDRAKVADRAHWVSDYAEAYGEDLESLAQKVANSSPDNRYEVSEALAAVKVVDQGVDELTRLFKMYRDLIKNLSGERSELYRRWRDDYPDAWQKIGASVQARERELKAMFYKPDQSEGDDPSASWGPQPFASPDITAFRAMVEHKEGRVRVFYREEEARLEVLQAILETDDRGRTSLHRSALHHDCANIEATLATLNTEKAGSKEIVDVLDADGLTPLMLAIARFNTERGVFEHNQPVQGGCKQKVIDLLLEHGASASSLRTAGHGGMNALHLAVYVKDLASVATLINYTPRSGGSELNLNAATKLVGYTPLMLAVHQQWARGVELILEEAGGPASRLDLSKRASMDGPNVFHLAALRLYDDTGSKIFSLLLKEAGSYDLLEEKWQEQTVRELAQNQGQLERYNELVDQNLVLH